MKMRSLCVALLLCACSVRAVNLNLLQRRCDAEAPNSGLTNRYSENVAHAVHSMTVQGLRLFNPKATEQNSVPTVNHSVSALNKVVPFAPDDPWGSDYSTDTMNIIDKILSNVGKANDGLGPYWSPIERVVHNFHMWDLWIKIKGEYDEMLRTKTVPTKVTCACLRDVSNNGVRDHVQWVADHYKAGTPITLLNRPIPKLMDAATWGVWKERLLYYYTQPALRDAAMYLHCAAF